MDSFVSKFAPSLLYKQTEPTSFRLGGQPIGIAEWPLCQTCRKYQSFIGRFKLDSIGDSLQGLTLELFICPGDCSSWRPDSGENLAVVTSSEDIISAPESVEIQPLEFSNLVEYDESTVGPYFDIEDREKFIVVGKFGGEADWLQGEEPQECGCGHQMTFLLQLEDPYMRHGFGDGGFGYVFICTRCRNRAKFLWQC